MTSVIFQLELHFILARRALITHLRYDPGNGLFFAKGEITKHIGNNISLTNFGRARGHSWSPDADPKTKKILTPQPGNNGINPFVSTRATALPDCLWL